MQANFLFLCVKPTAPTYHKENINLKVIIKMKQTLLKTMVLTLALLGGASSVWADWDGTSPVYSPTTDANYADLKTAISAQTAGTSETPATWNIHIYSDATLGTADDSSIGVPAYTTLNIVPQNDVKLTRGNHKRGKRWFLVNQTTSTLNIGSDSKTLTLEDDGSTIIVNSILRRENGIMNVNNVTFNNIKFGNGGTNEYGYLYSTKNTSNGYCIFKNVTVSNCTTTTTSYGAFISSLATNVDAIYLQGAINFTDCTGTDMYIAARIRLGEYDGSSPTTISASTPITVYWANATTTGTPVIVKASKSEGGHFILTNDGLGISGNGTDLKISAVYTATVTEAGAATLVLPFKTRMLPTGVSAYKLTYSSGDNITATAESYMTANKPMLIVASAGSYTFVPDEYKESLPAFEATLTNGVLTGVSTETILASGDYILTNHSGSVGFRKVNGSTNTVSAYHAYIPAASVSSHPANAPAFYSIMYGGDGNNGTTAIQAVDVEKPLVDDGVIYNLQGVRMTGSNLPKGIYVKNGKKFIVK